MKKLLTIVLTVSMLASSFAAINVAAEKSDDLSSYENVAISEIEEILGESYSQFYDINSVVSEAKNSEMQGNVFTTEVHTTLNTVLKADSVVELPYVQGMLEVSGVSKLDACKDDITPITITANINENKKLEVAKAIEKKLSDLEEYIGTSSDNNFWLYVEAEVIDGELNLDTMSIMAENIDRLIPIEDILPASASEQKLNGVAAMKAVINAPTTSISTSSTATSRAYADYRRIAARDYALSFVGSNVTTCYAHGTSCGVRQDPTYYNANFSYYQHNDCANFVSQCLNAGDVWEDSVWYPTSYAWINTQGLKNHMLNTKGYWYTSNFANANAGAVLYTSSSHVVLITLNDTVTHKYTGHTNDRYNVTFTNQSGYAYYML